ncbi:MAG: thrombospondin type 3 repeat-containing protein [Gemmatimonadaceae bacterium]
MIANLGLARRASGTLGHQASVSRTVSASGLKVRPAATIRCLGSFSTFSWTVPDGEIWHGFTIGVRGLADASADTGGDGVPDASDNCPAVANAGQSDSDGDGIGDAYRLRVGSHTLSASATDNAGNQRAASTSFTVTVNSGNICELVKRWVSNAGVANSMCVKLRQGSYGAFRNKLSAQGGR